MFGRHQSEASVSLPSQNHRPLVRYFYTARRLILISTLAAACLAEAQSHSSLLPEELARLRGQHFVCNTGYTREMCHEQSTKLASVLVRFHDRLPKEWTWVLVKSYDWPHILRGLNVDSRSPAFSALDKRETFLNQSLFASAAPATAELLHDFSVPTDKILTVAVSHELGHAYCREFREREAENFAQQLRAPVAAQCSPSENSAQRDTIRTLSPPK